MPHLKFLLRYMFRLQLLQRDHIQDRISKETFRVGANLPDIYHACKLAHFGNVSSMEKRFMFSDSSFFCRSIILSHAHLSYHVFFQFHSCSPVGGLFVLVIYVKSRYNRNRERAIGNSLLTSTLASFLNPVLHSWLLMLLVEPILSSNPTHTIHLRYIYLR